MIQGTQPHPDSMVAIYVLKLVRGKYYVGLTRRNIDRVLDHLDGANLGKGGWD